MNNKPNYRESKEQPESIGKMAGIIFGKGRPMMDSNTAAIHHCGTIYFDWKHSILVGDHTRETIRTSLLAAIKRVEDEVVVQGIKEGAIAKFNAMLKALDAGANPLALS